MLTISPKLGEFLIKTTGRKDIDDAFHKVFSDYIELKLKSLQEVMDINQFLSSLLHSLSSLNFVEG